jgi:EAL domain-containing protein (putative c-di-GMP-specific phosphodiesterase class I)
VFPIEIMLSPLESADGILVTAAIRDISVRKAAEGQLLQALLAGMAYFAVKRKIRLVAEGIETGQELATLQSLAIHYGQGYLLGRPQDGRGSGPWPTVVALGTKSEKGPASRSTADAR